VKSTHWPTVPLGKNTNKLNVRGLPIAVLFLLCIAGIGIHPAQAQSNAGPQGYGFCSSENGTCVFNGAANVAYGANGSFIFRTFADGAPCNNGVFGSDPAPGVAKACFLPGPQGNAPCSAENGTCPFSGTATVAYGASGNFISHSFTDGTVCSNEAFGSDPAPGIGKACFLPAGPEGYTFCSAENNTCTFRGEVILAYGADSKFLFQSFNNGAACGNGVFGSDPAPGVAKACFLPAGPQGYTFCSAENNTCLFRSTTNVAYGANGHFIIQTATNGTACNSGAFGSDPAPGVVKACFVPPTPIYGSAGLIGFVDLHTHPMANLGFGGKLLYGGLDGGPNGGSLLPADPSCNHNVRATSIAQALGHDKSTHGGWGVDNTCGNDARSNIIHLFQQLLNANDPPDDASGFPDFPDWPTWNDLTHQKMWVDSINRAYLGGLRVMVALATSNKTLGDVVGDSPTDDKTLGDLQIAEIKSFVGRHQDFMEIAYESADVERIVRANRLAVVLGVELDNIGNMNTVQPLTTDVVSAEIARLYNEGVRYIFPIHVIDNPFGGTAAYEDLFNISNFQETGHFWALGCAPPTDRITYQFSSASAMLAFLTTTFNLSYPPMPSGCSGMVNTAPLTDLGKFALREMMRRGMLIDIDHMSEAVASAALDIAEQVPGGGYPFNSGHNGTRCFVPSLCTERSLTWAQYRRIGNLHGMAGVGSGDLDAYQWVQMYSAVVQAMGNNAIAGFGTDTNGFAPGMPPRPASSVVYDASFPKSSLGNKQWDYNSDGVAHYGMLADFLKDARTAPGGAELIDNNLMHGADYFLQTWRKSEAQSSQVPLPAAMPSMTLTLVPPAGTADDAPKRKITVFAKDPKTGAAVNGTVSINGSSGQTGAPIQYEGCKRIDPTTHVVNEVPCAGTVSSQGYSTATFTD
jgi:hypothetical protein